ncbi:phage integrase family protein [Robbsia sp. KACC 23696]|uniref:phage integrase family protein n=1 Tax=Robbsia sp. KACC 23696 TaxID=3149231 RepID=UPI00325BDD9B
MPLNLRRLESSHFAFYRAYLEGSEALDLPALADRYLNCGRDPRRVRALLRWLQDELAAAARRNADWEALRLLRLPKSLGQKGDGYEAPPTPSLSDFAAQNDPDNVFGEAELIALYRERYPDVGDRRGRATKAARLRERRLTALRRLQHIAVDAPVPSHAVDGWFDENVVMRMHRAGITSLAQLCETINGHGVRWYRHIPQLGPIGATRIVRWVQANAESLGGVVSRLLPDPTDAEITTDRPIRGHGQRLAILPIEDLADRGIPAEVSGANGSNRGVVGRQSIDAQTDVAAVLAWLDAQAGSAHTRRAYRTQAERILLWAVVECNKPLSSLDHDDINAYRRFLASPPASWCAPRHTPRWSVRWRPFAGPLTESSRATAANVLKALFRWLVSAGYLQTDPWRAARENARAADEQTTGAASISEDGGVARAESFDSRMRLRVERVVEAEQWQALAHFANESPHESDQRAFCMLILSRFAGLRLQELRTLRVGDVALPTDASGRGAVTVLTQPAVGTPSRLATSRTVVIPPEVFPLLRRYIALRDARQPAGGAPAMSPFFARLQNEQQRRSDARTRDDAGSPLSSFTGNEHGRARTLSDGPMHATALARTISDFLDRATEWISASDTTMPMSMRRIRTGDCRHGYIRTGLLASVPTEHLQQSLGLRSTGTINAHRRALASVRVGVGAA